MIAARQKLQELLDAAMDNGQLTDEEYEACEAYLNGEEDEVTPHH